MRRIVVQIISALAANPFLSMFGEGRIYRGSSKRICVPGLNCYSCPAAAGACPLGALQAINADPVVAVSLYVTGLIIFFGALMGRWICGWLCPFGFIQELLHRIPSPAITLPRWMASIKYWVLVIFVIGIPLIAVNEYGVGVPAFCKYICPAGTLEAGIPLVSANPALRSAAGWLFVLKVMILIVTIFAAIIIYRPFCRILCPLGAIYGLFNPWAAYRHEYDPERCLSCGACITACQMDVQPCGDPNSRECIRCGDCLKVCPSGAIKSVISIKDVRAARQE